MNTGIIIADYNKGKLAQIEFPSFGTTGELGPCLGLGFYNPKTNGGYILHRMPRYKTPRDMIFSEVDSNLKEDRSECYILAAGLGYLFIDKNHYLRNEHYLSSRDLKCSNEWAKKLLEGIHSKSIDIDNQLEGLLQEMGFDTRKLNKFYNGQDGTDEIGFMVIDTKRGFAEINTLPDSEIRPSNLPLYKGSIVRHRIQVNR